jgi:hypothetical protein
MLLMHAIRMAVLAGCATALLAADEGRRPAGDASLRFWLENMMVDHAYTIDEASAATGMGREELTREIARLGIGREKQPPRAPDAPVKLRPYPGGRHPRIGFLDGAVDPQRDTKVSAFTPWDPASYVVVDLPEAIFTNLGLTYLAHSHIPTIWTEQGVRLEPKEWTVGPEGVLTTERTLPNGIAFGAVARAKHGGADMELWLHNGTKEPLTGMRVQVCVMLKGARGFAAQTNDNKMIKPPFVACRDETGLRWIITAWEPLNRAWANPPVPCLHSDPAFPDCEPGATVRARGKLWFFEGEDVEAEISRLEQMRSAHTQP